MAETFTADLFPLSTDETPWRKLTSDFVSVDTFKGQEVLTIEPEGLRLLSETAFADIALTFEVGNIDLVRIDGWAT